MANTWDRRRIFVKGLGTLEVRETDPSPAPQFSAVGALQDMALNDEHSMVEVVGDTGKMLNFLSSAQKVSGVANLWQTSIDEVDLLRNSAAKLHAVRYGGQATPNKFQMYSFPEARISPAVALEFKVGGRAMPMLFNALSKQGLAYTVPYYYFVERAGTMRLTNLNFWVDARHALNIGTGYLLDVSGYEYHGNILPSGDVAGCWQTGTAVYFLRFDGTDTYVTFGDVMDDDGTSDFLIEVWVRVVGADSTAQEILSKQSAVGTAGFGLIRNASNKIAFELGDGTGNVTATTSSNVTQNVWTHYAIAVDRNGNMQPYLNGASNGSAAAVGGEGTGTNAIDFYLARLGSAYGQVDIGSVRKYLFGAGGLPSDIATIVSNHYTAEHEYYGL